MDTPFIFSFRKRIAVAGILQFLVKLSLVVLLLGCLDFRVNAQALNANAKRAIAAIEAGNAKAAAEIILMDQDELARFINPKAPGFVGLKNNANGFLGMTGRQIYGALLANWAARNKSKLGGSYNATMLDARNHILSAPLKRGMLADEAVWLLENVDPKDPQKAKQVLDTAIKRLLADGRSKQLPGQVRAVILKRAAARLRHDSLQGQRIAEADKVVTEIKGLLPPNLPAHIRQAILNEASGKKAVAQRNGTPRQPQLKPAKVSSPTIKLPSLAGHDWRNTSGKSMSLRGKKTILMFVLPGSRTAKYRIKRLEELQGKIGGFGWQSLVVQYGGSAQDLSRSLDIWGTKLPVARVPKGLTEMRFRIAALPLVFLIDENERIIAQNFDIDNNLAKVIQYLASSPLDPTLEGAHLLAQPKYAAAKKGQYQGKWLAPFGDADVALAFAALSGKPGIEQAVARELFPKDTPAVVSKVVRTEIQQFVADAPVFSLGVKVEDARYRMNDRRIQTSFRGEDSSYKFGDDYLVVVEGSGKWKEFAATLDNDQLNRAFYDQLKSVWHEKKRINGKFVAQKRDEGIRKYRAQGSVPLEQPAISIIGHFVRAESRGGKKIVYLRPVRVTLSYGLPGNGLRKSVLIP